MDGQLTIAEVDGRHKLWSGLLPVANHYHYSFSIAKQDNSRKRQKTDNVNLISSAKQDFLEVIWHNDVSHIQLTDLYTRIYPIL